MRKFHRRRGQRRAFLKVLANNLIMKEKIETTNTRAKEIRSFIEPLVTIAKRQKLSDLRILLSRLPKSAAQKLFYKIASRYSDRKGGYLKIIKESRSRKRDGAPLSIIEFV